MIILLLSYSETSNPRLSRAYLLVRDFFGSEIWRFTVVMHESRPNVQKSEAVGKFGKW